MSVAQQFVGTWKAVETEDRLSDGTVTYPPYGQFPKGYLIYDALGHMAGQLMNPGRQPISFRKSPAEEVRAAALAFIAYSGRYTVNEKEGAVIHHVEIALNPSLVGVDNVRYYEFSGDLLTLSVPPYEEDGITHHRKLVWRRCR